MELRCDLEVVVVLRAGPPHSTAKSNHTMPPASPPGSYPPRFDLKHWIVVIGFSNTSKRRLQHASVAAPRRQISSMRSIARFGSRYRHRRRARQAVASADRWQAGLGHDATIRIQAVGRIVRCHYEPTFSSNSFESSRCRNHCIGDIGDMKFVKQSSESGRDASGDFPRADSQCPLSRRARDDTAHELMEVHARFASDWYHRKKQIHQKTLAAPDTAT